MYRFVAWLFALLLPLQFAWGAAAAHCQHETTIESSRHIGHHEHIHKVDVKTASDTELVADNDCGTCHATCSAVASEASGSLEVPVVARRVVSPAFLPPASALARAPDRPQWPRFA